MSPKLSKIYLCSVLVDRAAIFLSTFPIKSGKILPRNNEIF